MPWIISLQPKSPYLSAFLVGTGRDVDFVCVQDVVRLTSATDFAEGRNSQSSHLTWSDRVSRLAGTNSDPVLIKGICETVPLKMLVFRVNKKLIIWDVLLLAEMSIP
jgi:hypothetical protein